MQNYLLQFLLIITFFYYSASNAIPNHYKCSRYCNLIQIMKGLHFGKIELGSNSIQFKYPEKDQTNLFKIPFNKINTSSVNKNDIILELKDSGIPNATALTQQDLLCQIRFFNDTIKQPEIDAEDQDGEKKETVNFAETLHNEIVEKANIGKSSGESIATIQELSLGVPRGKYTVDFYQRNLRFHGSTFNYNVNYKEILKGIILPMSQQNRTVIVLQLEKPIIQGQTVHPFIVIQISREDDAEVKTNVKPEYLKENPHLKDVKPEYTGSLESVVVDMLKTITNIDLVVPGDHFKSQEGQPCVKCSLKAQTGWLYFLKKSMIFIMKPVIYFRVDDIDKVEIQRGGAANKQFDIKIFLKNKQVSQYIGIDRGEHDAISEYFKQKEVRVVRIGQEKVVQIEHDSEESDEDFEGGEEESSSGDDEDSGIVDESDSNKK